MESGCPCESLKSRIKQYRNMIVLIIVFIIISFLRAFFQTSAGKKRVSERVNIAVMILHLALAGVLAFFTIIKSSPDGTKYFINGLEATNLVENPISKFFAMFLIFGGLVFLLSWLIIELILFVKKRISEMSAAEKLASSSIFIGIIAFPVSIILMLRLAQKAWPFFIATAAFGAAFGIISCILSKKKNFKFHKRAIAGIIFSAYYCLVAIVMINQL